ncbi:hypothetical protein [Bordetella bronchialis]|uniref:hypothetical protein n=1 Tax=Bordetella bronchialis TaxID=463025 RepID=UPI000B173C27|nr:hypothetical protein [Bordetella bronchialis]
MDRTPHREQADEQRDVPALHTQEDGRPCAAFAIPPDLYIRLPLTARNFLACTIRYLESKPAEPRERDRA